MMMKRRDIPESKILVSAHGEIFDSIVRLIGSFIMNFYRLYSVFVRFSGWWLSWDVSESRILDHEGTALPQPCADQKDSDSYDRCFGS